MKVIYVLAPDIGSKIIKLADGGPFSHVATSYTEGKVIEATFAHGVWERLESSLLLTRPIHQVLEFDLPKEQESLEWAKTTIGAKYDYKAIISLGIRCVFGTSPNLEAPGRYFCDEHTLSRAVVGGYTVEGPLRNYGVEASRQWFLARGARIVSENY